MSSEQKRGFRLPWAPDHAPEAGSAAAATLDPASPRAADGATPDALGDGPVRLADDSTPSTSDAGRAASVPPGPTAEAAMIEMQTDSTAEPAVNGSGPGDGQPHEGAGWPDVDRQGSDAHARDAELAAARPAIRAAGRAGKARRENPLVAGLVKAMREAAITSRDETLARLKVEAQARAEEIRGMATSEAAVLQKRAETDIAEIREWSKAEIARIRIETEDRIEARRVSLAHETERHGASVERLVGDVEAVVAAFEADMERFFKTLLAENDPARLAALAEQAPDAPDLSGNAPRAIDLVYEVDDDAAPPAPDDEALLPEASVEPEALEATDAAAAEVAAAEGLDINSAGEWPVAVLASAPQPARSQEHEAVVEMSGATRLHVSGLSSVAGISAFKGGLGQIPGVLSVSVSTGERGVFVFAVSHEPGIDLASGLESLIGFNARITGATDDEITVAAHEPA